MRYEQLGPISREEFETARRSHESDERARAILRLALHDGDPAFIEAACVGFLGDSHIAVRRAAVTSIGHSARLHGTIAEATRRNLDRFASERDLSGVVADVLDDIAQYTQP